MHAKICPVCKGSGTIPLSGSASVIPYNTTCHGCGGFGWVTVKDIIDEETP